MQNKTRELTSIGLFNARGGARGGPKLPPNIELLERVRNLQERLDIREAEALQHLVMLREGDHRIKNSLQLVSSLMRLQAGREEWQPARDALLAASARVVCVAEIHDALQDSGGQGFVDFASVLRKVCVATQGMAGDNGHIDVVVQAEALELPVLLARSLALAVNELVLNALRHGFPTAQDGCVRVSVASFEGEVTVCVADNGIGLPADYAAAPGFGMKLVAMLVKQVDGALRVEQQGGAAFMITAPIMRALDDVALEG